MATARVIDGKALADELSRRVGAAAADVAAAAGTPPGLVAILVGDDPASHSYVGRKDRAAAAAGLAAQTLALPATTSQAALLAEIERLNRDDRVDGILVQLPLPAHIEARRIIAAVDPAKDVDGFHPLNIGRLWSGLPGLVPATPQGCMLLLKSVHADLAGLEAIVIGRSNIVGKPMAALLLAADCSVGWAHSRSRDAASICRRADILVAAAGRPQLVRPHWIKPGATVIDVGINRIPAVDGKSRLVGDVDYPAASGVAGAITPVPGGVGPMTIACLLRNTLLAACRRRGFAEPAL
ncbi:MAG TPA: bifunctional methylenetetrahydrofolate dehydrogenase/methenyltetrahydrofolate cyclohydrolase FolD [Stellaceae bacterium]|nr:bifunctional methylenetetrahydrofolate dehydrogenase/methenyltetrahydrofolate cyclohydrolase FolD [Stellaceae bacterium]